MNKGSLDDQGAQNFFNQIWKLWLKPEINRRLEAENKSTYALPYLILIRFPPDKKHQVLLDNEVKLFVKAKFTGNKKLKKYDRISMDDISDYLEILELPEALQKNDSYIIMIRHKKSWNILFDFRQWKGEIKEKYDKINEFIQTSTFALTNKHYSAFVDNLFSASELIIDIMLLMSLSFKIRSHSYKTVQYTRIQKQKTREETDFVTTHNKLFALRPDARYAKNALQLDHNRAKKMLHIIETRYKKLEQPVSSFIHFNGNLE